MTVGFATSRGSATDDRIREPSMKLINVSLVLEPGRQKYKEALTIAVASHPTQE